jgi:hypothetical protein
MKGTVAEFIAHHVAQHYIGYKPNILALLGFYR